MNAFVFSFGVVAVLVLSTTVLPPRKMSKIVWIDMEMSGLDVRKNRIMEIACLISDNHLNVLAEHPTIVIHQPDTELNAMDEWCTQTHTKVSETVGGF